MTLPFANKHLVRNMDTMVLDFQYVSKIPDLSRPLNWEMLSKSDRLTPPLSSQNRGGKPKLQDLIRKCLHWVAGSDGRQADGC